MARASSSESRWLSGWAGLLPGVLAALFTAFPLIPSEAAVPFGSHVLLIMGWLVLTAIWLTRCLCEPRPVWRLGVADAVLLLFFVAHSASALIMLSHGHPRLTLNALWVWVSFAMLLLSVRQLASRGVAQRALASVAIALAAGMAALGSYQVVYQYPQRLADYQANPLPYLRAAGLTDQAPDAPERRHFEDRMRSTEPIGPFALTNSLAGYLAPTLILVLGLARQMGRTMVRPRMWQGILVMTLAALVAALLLACFVLTKSRAAYLATAMGVLALAATHAIPRRWWRWCGAAAAVLALGVLLLASLGGLDRQVLTEAPKSLLYRMQYWQASWAMIAEHPWFGCGPGNFKDAYTQYKLPEASETVADPHNFLVEIAATAGIPVALLSLMAAAAVIWQVRRTQRETRGDEPVLQTAPASDADDSPDDVSLVRTVYVGGLAGCLLAYPAGWAGGQTPDLAMLWTLVPVFLVTLWLLHPWVVRGRLPATTLLIAVGTLLVNLLAAGGIAFPGVAGLLWLLVALALNAAETGSGDVASDTWLSPVGPVVNRGVIAGAAAASLALVALGYVTLYRPVLAGQIFAAQLADALEGRMNATQITAACRQAAQADLWWAEPYERWAAIAHQQWLAHPTPERLDEFNRAVAGARERNRWSSSLARSEGDWLLAMYHGSRQIQLLQRAAEAYTRAVALYPNSGTLRAQLAWTWYLLGDRQRAAAMATEALQLDEQMPHEELKLKYQRLAGLQTSPAQAEQPPTAEGANTEQVMRDLRKLSRSR